MHGALGHGDRGNVQEGEVSSWKTKAVPSDRRLDELVKHFGVLRQHPTAMPKAWKKFIGKPGGVK